MRHGKRRTRLGRQTSHRKATMRSLARSIVISERIKTTQAKAKEAKRVIEKLITIAKKDTLAARRQVYAVLGSRDLVKKLFKEIAPLFKKRSGGYTRIIPFNFRKGDGASMVFLELTERKPEEKPKVIKKTKKTEAKAAPKKAEKEVKKQPQKAAPVVEPKEKDEKTVEHIKKAKVINEVKKIKQKGFMKKMKGLFRRKSSK